MLDPKDAQDITYTSALKRTFLIGSGMFVGIIIICLFGFLATSFAEGREFTFHAPLIAAAFIAVAASCLTVVGRWYWKRVDKTFIFGLALGAGVMCLIEGACFWGG